MSPSFIYYLALSLAVVVLPSSCEGSVVTFDVLNVFYPPPDQTKNGYIAAIVILTLLAAGLTVAHTLLTISNRSYYASKSQESDDEEEGNEVEMRNVMEGASDEDGEHEEDSEGRPST